MSNKKKRIIIAVLIILLLVIGVVAGIFCFQYFESKKYQNANEQELSQANDNTVYYEGKEYVYNYNLKNILFLGIDNESVVKQKNNPGTGGQADSIMILSIDKENNTSRILQISRDSMTDVDIYDTQGEYYTTIKAQLATQYAYGNTANTSCWATKKTVSELLYDLPIAGYISLDIAGIPLINNYVGGVTLTIPEDYTEIDSSFVKGKTLTLNGEQAEKYVRYRDTDAKGSNQLRMQRQVQYIPALKEAFAKKVENSEDAADEIESLISPYLVTDLSTDDISELTDYSWDLDNVSYVPGEVVSGEKNEEFHVNEKKLQEMIIKMFYKLKK